MTVHYNSVHVELSGDNDPQQTATLRIVDSSGLVWYEEKISLTVQSRLRFSDAAASATRAMVDASWSELWSNRAEKNANL